MSENALYSRHRLLVLDVLELVFLSETYTMIALSLVLPAVVLPHMSLICLHLVLVYSASWFLEILLEI